MEDQPAHLLPTVSGPPDHPWPAGTVTFLFTDIEGSTQLWENHRQAMGAALAQHDALLRAAIAAHHGRVIKSTGDGLHAVFASAAQAAGAVLAGQRALRAQAWPETGPLRVRMALHTGQADQRDGDYFGPALNRAARLMAVAAGGQSLVSQATATLIQDDLPAQAGLLDLGEHRLKDLVRPERIFQLSAADLPADFPRLTSLNAFPHNLPAQLTSFVGREREMVEVRALLLPAAAPLPPSFEGRGAGGVRSTDGVRLLTLTGPGGTGKTRLSLQVAADLLPEYPDGAWLVELAPLTDPANLVAAVAAVFDVRDAPGRPLLSVLIDYLRNKHGLLLLDNCEHLIDACARLADELLHACPSLQILACSREALGLAGETIYHLSSLALPAAHTDADTPASFARLADNEAVRLFVERARAAQPRFALTEANAPAVAAICRRLDGIPLALELAAARVRVLSVEQILARLDDVFHLLVGGSRTALPRQQTLRALIDWSYNLLPPDECRLLRQLSVFAGGASLEAIEAVGKADEGRRTEDELGDASSSVFRPSSVLDLLTQLVNKSIVVVDQDEIPRYRLLETIKQYAREKLLEAADGEAATASERHLAFFLGLIDAAEPRLMGANLIAALDELEAEQDNLRAALQWALSPDHANPFAALRLVSVLWFFFASRGSAAEGRRWAAAALQAAAAAAPGAAPPPAAVARVWTAEAALALQLGDSPAALAAAKTAMALARQAGDMRTLTLALGVGATLIGRAGEMDTATTWAEERLALARQHGYHFELSLYAGVHLFREAMGHPAGHPALQAELLAAARASGSPLAIATTVQNGARVSAMLQDYAVAQHGFEESAALFHQIGDRHSENASRSERGHVLRRQGRHAQATAAYTQTVRVWQALGERAALAHELECLAFVALAAGPAERAATLLGAAEALRERSGATMSVLERPEYDQAVAQLQAQAPPVLVAEAWARGRALGLEAAVSYALA